MGIDGCEPCCMFAGDLAGPGGMGGPGARNSTQVTIPKDVSALAPSCNFHLFFLTSFLTTYFFEVFESPI